MVGCCEQGTEPLGTIRSISRRTQLLFGQTYTKVVTLVLFNSLNAKLNPICHLLALLGAHHILHVSRIRVK